MGRDETVVKDLTTNPNGVITEHNPIQSPSKVPLTFQKHDSIHAFV